MRYRAIYEFSARNQDEITFQPGDTIMVRMKHFPLQCNESSHRYRFVLRSHTSRMGRSVGWQAKLTDTRAGSQRPMLKRLMTVARFRQKRLLRRPNLSKNSPKFYLRHHVNNFFSFFLFVAKLTKSQSLSPPIMESLTVKSTLHVIHINQQKLVTYSLKLEKMC